MLGSHFSPAAFVVTLAFVQSRLSERSLEPDANGHLLNGPSWKSAGESDK